MNKYIGMAAFFCSLVLGGSSAHAAMMGSSDCCAPEPACPEDQKLDSCWCLYVHYEPCYYQVPCCVEEVIPCKKRCCRYVEKCQEVQKCRYVPEYYTETYTYCVPEYYEVDDCQTCTKTVYETQCEYKPCYYWKNNCGDVIPCNR